MYLITLLKIMQNFAETDFTRPASTSQLEDRRQRINQAARDRRQARFSAETSAQRQARLEAERERTRQRRQQQTSEQRQQLLAQRRQRRQQESAEERSRRLDYHRQYNQGMFETECVGDRQRRLALARLNVTERLHNETNEQYGTP